VNRLRIAVVGKEGSGKSTDAAERQALRAKKPDGHNHFLIYRQAAPST
jgi:adenylate kinase family enzyme